jgi:hypothetical protein
MEYYHPWSKLKFGYTSMSNSPRTNIKATQIVAVAVVEEPQYNSISL